MLRRKCAAALAVLLFAASANAAVIVSSSGNTGTTAMQIPSVVATSPWRMAYDPSTAAGDVTATASKGLYTQSAGITAATNMTWANTTGGGIQMLLPHTAGSNAVLGLGALNQSAVFDPANVDASTGGIASLSASIIVRQTSTPNDSGQIALLLVQGGKYYRSSWSTFKGTANATIDYTDLTAASFGEITISRLGSDGGNTDFARNPNFTSAGTSIQLGWLSGYDASLGTTDANNRSIVTSWSVSVTGVPEPSLGGALMIAAIMPCWRGGKRQGNDVDRR